MNLPDWVREVTGAFEGRDEPYYECEVADALHAARKSHGDLSDQEWKGFLAEWSAFLFIECRGAESVWHTHFAPMMSGKTPAGDDFYSPDLKSLDSEIVAHWEERAGNCDHPVMRARYADLIWDLKKAITGQRPVVEYAWIAIDSYVEAAQKRLYPMEVVGIQWLQRALNLSRSINDIERTNRIVDVMFYFYDRIAQPQLMGTWLFLFDALYGKPFISPEQEVIIIRNLEAMLTIVSDTRATPDGVYPTLDPWGAQAAAERLARHYHRLGDRDSVTRVIKSYGSAFERMAKDANPMMAMAWLEPVIERYEQEGLKTEAENLQLRSAEKGKNIDSDLKRVSVSVEVSADDLNKLVEELLGSGDLNTSLFKVASFFIPRASYARNLLEEMKARAPLMSVIPITMIDQDGHSAAKIGSLEDDPDGRLHRQLAQVIQFHDPFLIHVLSQLKERNKPSVDDLLGFLCLSPLFERGVLIQDGLAAYQGEDFIKAIHVLVPQIESALRRFMGASGIPILKTIPGHPGIQDAKSMNDVLRDERMREALTENLWRYLSVLYIDKRGLNLRNDLAHGLVPPQAFSRQVADRVFHSLLALSLMRAKSSSR